MDIQMPIMDGIQATKEIRRLEKFNSDAGYPPLLSSLDGRGPPEVHSASANAGSFSENKSLNSPYRSSVIIVALTASSLQSDRVAALAAGCNDFLTKPVSLLWLNNKIIEWGSIKALQMWADIRPEAVRSMTSSQAQQAMSIAEKLQVPKGKNLPSPNRGPTSAMDENAAVLALASSGGLIPNMSSSGGANVLSAPTNFTSTVLDRSHDAGTSSAQISNSLSERNPKDALENRSNLAPSGFGECEPSDPHNV
jgi:osomolarity two-component system response regulator SSK1